MDFYLSLLAFQTLITGLVGASIFLNIYSDAAKHGGIPNMFLEDIFQILKIIWYMSGWEDP